MKNPVGLQVFANRLRLLRQTRGYSQQKLADIANVEQSTIKRIELRQLAPTLDLLISLSRALALEVRDLVDDPAITHSDPEVSPAVASPPGTLQSVKQVVNPGTRSQATMRPQQGNSA